MVSAALGVFEGCDGGEVGEGELLVEFGFGGGLVDAEEVGA